MKEKIKKTLRIITTIVALLWIFSEIVFRDSWEEPSLTVIVGILIMWSIIMYSSKALKEGKQINENIGISFCRNCGAKPKEGANFCPQCGERIKS